MLRCVTGGAVAGADLACDVALLVAFVVIGSILDLPFEWYSTFRLEQRFGFNRMSWRLWLGDMAKGMALGAVIGVPLLAAMLWLMGAAAASGGFGPGRRGWRSSSPRR